MGAFLQTAYEILRTERRPLTPKDIVAFGQQRGLLDTTGRTPAQTMKAKLSTDILQHGEKSLFMRSGRGYFALREWTGEVGEYRAERFRAGLFDEDVVVLPASRLNELVSGIGLFPDPPDERTFYSLLTPMRRRDAEEDTSVIQLVSGFVVKHHSRILTYKRAKRLPEARLHGFYSLMFGGHLNPEDVSPMFSILQADLGNPWLLRELKEEVRLREDTIERLIFRGLLYDTSRPVSRQHLAVVFEVVCRDERFEIGERGFLIDPKFETLDDIKRRSADFENWSQILMDAICEDWREE